MTTLNYQAAYFWTCPNCHTVWQARHRPRGGSQLICAPGPEQTQPPRRVDLTSGPCGLISTSSGRRKGLPRL